MKNLTIRWRIMASFAVVLTLMVIMAGVAANYSLTLEFAHQADMPTKKKLQAAILSSRAYLDTLINEYAGTVYRPADRMLFDTYKGTEEVYRTAQDAVLKAGLDAKANHDQIVKRVSAELHPEFATAQSAVTAVVDGNKAEASNRPARSSPRPPAPRPASC